MKGRFDAVIFDMDGTLVEALLDFEAIRAELGIAPLDGILEAVERMSEPTRRAAADVLLAHELAAARQVPLMEGAAELLKRVAASQLKSALLTRNSRQAMEIVLGKIADAVGGASPFDVAWSREDGPIKPSPEGILRACRLLGAEPARTCAVGDFYYDVAAAKAAGAFSVLLDRGRRCDFAGEADWVIDRLDELTDLLEI